MFVMNVSVLELNKSSGIFLENAIRELVGAKKAGRPSLINYNPSYSFL